jgi:hypothetical protein
MPTHVLPPQSPPIKPLLEFTYGVNTSVLEFGVPNASKVFLHCYY